MLSKILVQGSVACLLFLVSPCPVVAVYTPIQCACSWFSPTGDREAVRRPSAAAWRIASTLQRHVGGGGHNFIENKEEKRKPAGLPACACGFRRLPGLQLSPYRACKRCSPEPSLEKLPGTCWQLGCPVGAASRQFRAVEQRIGLLSASQLLLKVGRVFQRMGEKGLPTVRRALP